MAAFMARSQVLNLADNFKAVITTAAWRKQTKLGAGSGSGQSHQSRSRTVVCHTSQQPQGRSLRRQSRGLRIQAKGGCSSDRRGRIARSVEELAKSSIRLLLRSATRQLLYRRQLLPWRTSGSPVIQEPATPGSERYCRSVSSSYLYRGVSDRGIRHCGPPAHGSADTPWDIHDDL